MGRGPHNTYVPPKGWMTRAQAMAYLDVTIGAFDCLVKKFGIPKNIDKHHLLYSQKDIEAIARAGEL